MLTSPLRAIRGSIIVKQDDDEKTTDSGLIVTKDVRSFRKGTIVSIGNDCTNYQIGDRILYVKEAAYPIILDEHGTKEIEYHFIDNEDDVYVKLTE